MDALFAQHDKDKDGRLSWQEFSGEETKNEKAFKLMDADHNGKITKTVSNQTPDCNIIRVFSNKTHESWS